MNSSPSSGVETTAAAPGSRGFWAVAASITVIVLGANTALPLLTVYQTEWRFSTALLTVVYGLYTVGVLAAVFLLGPASDLVGRKRILIPALLLMAVGLVMGLAAPDIWFLMGSRLVQGLAVGMGVTTAVAALGELQADPGDHERIALTATVATVLGLAGGPLVAGSLAEYAPDPARTPYLIALALTGLVIAGVCSAPETVANRRPFRFRPVTVAVPPGVRGAFWLATLVEFTAYAVAGTFAGLGSSFARELLRIQSHFAAGLVVALLFLCSAGAQIALKSATLKAAMTGGLIVLLFGLAIFAFAVVERSGLAFFAGAAILGLGHGAAYLGSQELTDRIAPPDRRAQVFSAFQLGLYVGATAPALGVGFAAARLGLTLATLSFAGGVAFFAMLALAWLRLGRSVEAGIGNEAGA